MEMCGVLDSISLLLINLYGLLFSSLANSKVALTFTLSWFLPSLTKLCEARLTLLLLCVIYW